MILPGEWICLLTVLLQSVAGSRLIRHRDFPLDDYCQILLAGFLVEEICVRWIGIYDYSDRWLLYVDRVPVAVILAWPWIILTAREFVRRDRSGRQAWSDAFLVGAIVTLDAAIVEPLAVHARLWTWHQPGLFGVPAIGVLGWGAFAGCCVGASGRLAHWSSCAVIAAGSAMLLLTAAWWTIFRWLSPETGIVLVLSLAVLDVLLMRRSGAIGPILPASGLRFSGLACLVLTVFCNTDIPMPGQ